MNLVRKKSKDVWSGLIFIGVAILFLLSGRSLAIGSASHIGPGLFPVIICLILGLTGAVILFRGLFFGADNIVGFEVKPLILVIGTFVLFALIVNQLGLIISGAISILMTSYAAGKVRCLESMIFVPVLLMFCILIFILGLGVPLPLLPGIAK